MLDRRNATEKWPGTPSDADGSKDRTGNLWSILIFNKIIAEFEIFVSPAESNPNIRPIEDSEFDFIKPGDPDRGGQLNTEDAGNALWDPSFKGAPVVSSKSMPSGKKSDVPEDIGNNSYAHVALRGNYRSKWSVDQGFANIPVVCNRGPEFTLAQHASDVPLTADDWELLATPATIGIDSNTMRIHGGKSSWEGCVGYNDGHVAFENSFAPEQLSFAFRSNNVADNLFVSEVAVNKKSDLRVDAFLRVFQKGLPFNSQDRDDPNIYYSLGPGAPYNWVD